MPKIDTNLDIKGPIIEIPNINNGGKIKGDIHTQKANISDITPLNIRTILSDKVDAPIILNKHNLLIPDVEVDVKILKGK